MVKVNSLSVVLGPVVKVRGSVIALAGVETSVLLSSVNINVTGAELLGPVSELADPWVKVGPQLKTGSVDEVLCSAEKSSSSLSEACATHLCPAGPSEVICEVKSTGSELRVGPCVIVNPVISASAWLGSNRLMGCEVSRLTTGTAGEVGSGLGLKG